MRAKLLDRANDLSRETSKKSSDFPNDFRVPCPRKKNPKGARPDSKPNLKLIVYVAVTSCTSPTSMFHAAPQHQCLQSLHDLALPHSKAAKLPESALSGLWGHLCMGLEAEPRACDGAGGWALVGWVVQLAVAVSPLLQRRSPKSMIRWDRIGSCAGVFV